MGCLLTRRRKPGGLNILDLAVTPAVSAAGFPAPSSDPLH
jgi:hypothetical protein